LYPDNIIFLDKNVNGILMCDRYGPFNSTYFGMLEKKDQLAAIELVIPLAR